MNVYLDQVAALIEFCRADRESGTPTPSHVLDQALAATTESVGLVEKVWPLLLGLEPDREYSRKDHDDLGPEADAHVLAAFYLPGFERCRHATRESQRGGPRPFVAVLPGRYVGCHPCIRSRPMSQPRPGDGDRCDWCGSHGHTVFRPLTLRAGPLTAAGDACDECASAIIVAFNLDG